MLRLQQPFPVTADDAAAVPVTETDAFSAAAAVARPVLPLQASPSLPAAAATGGKHAANRE